MSINTLEHVMLYKLLIHSSIKQQQGPRNLLSWYLSHVMWVWSVFVYSVNVVCLYLLCDLFFYKWFYTYYFDQMLTWQVQFFFKVTLCDDSFLWINWPSHGYRVISSYQMLQGNFMYHSILKYVRHFVVNSVTPVDGPWGTV